MNNDNNKLLGSIVVGISIGTIIAWLWAIHTYTKLGG